MNENIEQTLKSNDTEEWLDTVWTRPIGYLWAKFFDRLNIHPNTVTVLSMIIGCASGYFFGHGSYRTEGTSGLIMNIIAVLLLVWANFYDSADGQLARMTGKKTRLGRILDGAAGDAWFVVIYSAIAVRFAIYHDYEFDLLAIDHSNETLTDKIIIGLAYWGICWIAGVGCHGRQCGLSDYYRNIHLFFLKGKAGSELDNSIQQKQIYKDTPWKGNVLYKLFLITYINYTKSQEGQSPEFQKLLKAIKEKYGSIENVPQDFKDRFREESLPLMKWANILTFNVRAISLYIWCLLDFTWVHLFFEIFILTSLYFYMRHKHESFSKAFRLELEQQ